MAGTTTQSGARVPTACTGTLNPCAVLTRLANGDDAHVEPRHGQRRHLDQLVRGLERIEDRGETEIEDAVERQHIHSHGKYDIKIGILAYGQERRQNLFSECSQHTRRIDMLTHALFARLEAKPGKEQEVAAFLMQGLQLANQETTTPVWFALRLGPTTFGIFDAFADEAGRQTHLNGPIAQALMAHAPALLAAPPAIEPIDVLGAKLPK